MTQRYVPMFGDLYKKNRSLREKKAKIQERLFGDISSSDDEEKLKFTTYGRCEFCKLKIYSDDHRWEECKKNQQKNRQNKGEKIKKEPSEQLKIEQLTLKKIENNNGGGNRNWTMLSACEKCKKIVDKKIHSPTECALNIHKSLLVNHQTKQRVIRSVKETIN